MVGFEGPPDVILCRSCAEVPASNLRIFYPPFTFFIFLFQLNFDPSFLPLAVRLYITKRCVLVCRGYFLLLYMVKMTFDFCIKCYINISMQLLVWFGSERNNVTSFTGRCWQGGFKSVGQKAACHGVASLCLHLYYALSNLRQKSLYKNANVFCWSWKVSSLWREENHKNQAVGHMWSLRERKMMHESGQNGQASLEHGNQIIYCDIVATAGISWNKATKEWLKEIFMHKNYSPPYIPVKSTPASSHPLLLTALSFSGLCLFS